MLVIDNICVGRLTTVQKELIPGVMKNIKDRGQHSKTRLHAFLARSSADAKNDAVSPLFGFGAGESASHRAGAATHLSILEGRASITR